MIENLEYDALLEKFKKILRDKLRDRKSVV